MPRRGNNTATARAAVGRPPVISAAEMLETATALAEEVGIDGLTMGLVADKLGVSAAALYHYVSGKEELVNLVIERVFARVEAPPPGPWDERLRVFERTVRNEFRRLRWGTPKIIINGEPPESLRRLFAIGADIISESGADDREVLLGYTAVYAFMVGQLWFDSATSETPGHEPQIRLATAHAALDSNEIFEYGIEVVIAGLKSHLEPQPKTKRKKR